MLGLVWVELRGGKSVRVGMGGAKRRKKNKCFM